jgi:GntR family transcriptional regulator
MTAGPNAIRIDVASPVPVYRQIGDAIRALLVAGSLKPGDLLPPVRQLGIDLAVHFNTVAEAYRTLSDEGWLDLKRGRGATVIDRPAPRRAPPEAARRFAQRMRELVAASRAEGMPATAIALELRGISEELEP